MTEIANSQTHLEAASVTVSKSSVEHELLNKIEPVLEGLGFECRDVEVLNLEGACIRVTLDRPTREPAISIDDCSKAHKLLNPMFDVWDPLPTAYTLEISSPGEQPRLRTLAHFKEALGQKIKFQSLDAIPLPAPSKPRKKWEGQLKNIEDDGSFVLVDSENKEHKLSISQIKNAVWMRVWTP